LLVAAGSSRHVVAALALAGALIAGYLTLVQVRVVDQPWDPVFGHGSYDVLHSAFSRALPLPDAGLGLAAYLLEAGLALTGGGDRWARRPLLPLAFDLVGLALAVAAIGLVLLQATEIGSWCLLCLGSAAVSMAILATGRLREARAAVPRLRRDHRGAVTARG
jgi:uncharacterized membrane protein